MEVPDVLEKLSSCVLVAFELEILLCLNSCAGLEKLLLCWKRSEYFNYSLSSSFLFLGLGNGMQNTFFWHLYQKKRMLG